jgi:hypothetical protein
LGPQFGVQFSVRPAGYGQKANLTCLRKGELQPTGKVLRCLHQANRGLFLLGSQFSDYFKKNLPLASTGRYDPGTVHGGARAEMPGGTTMAGVSKFQKIERRIEVSVYNTTVLLGALLTGRIYIYIYIYIYMYIYMYINIHVCTDKHTQIMHNKAIPESTGANFLSETCRSNLIVASATEPVIVPAICFPFTILSAPFPPRSNVSKASRKPAPLEGWQKQMHVCVSLMHTKAQVYLSREMCMYPIVQGNWF